MSLTRQEKLDAQAAFAEEKACPDCGGLHRRACPRVRRQVWLRTGPGSGERTEVEFWPPGWDDTGVIWPEDAYDPSDPEATGE